MIISFETAYRALPLPYGDWAFLLPFPGVPILLMVLATLLLAAIAYLLHRRAQVPMLRNLALVCIPLWAGFIFVFNAKAWLVWTVGWFYLMLLLVTVILFIDRRIVPYALTMLLAALIQHQGSVFMVFALART